MGSFWLQQFKKVWRTDGPTNGLTWVGARDTCVSRKRVSFRKKKSNFFSTGFNVWISTLKVVTRELSAQPVCTLTSLHFARKHFLLHRKLSNQPAVTLTRTRITQQKYHMLCFAYAIFPQIMTPFHPPNCKSNVEKITFSSLKCLKFNILGLESCWLCLQIWIS